jgi:hypothetical protein
MKARKGIIMDLMAPSYRELLRSPFLEKVCGKILLFCATVCGPLMLSNVVDVVKVGVNLSFHQTKR